MGWAGGGSAHTSRRYREGYIYAYPFIIGKKVISVSASICCDLDSYPSIHPSIRLYILYLVSSRILYLTAAAADRSDCHRN